MVDTKKGNEVAITTSPASLLQLAIEKDADIDKLEKLMALQERWDANNAKKAFLVAMTDFQSKCPVIKKAKQVKFGNTAYKHATLGGIAKQISKLLKECGLSYTWRTEESDKDIKITCTVSHIDGHSEGNTMRAGLDSSGSKNPIQQVGSTMTYLQRYTLIGSLGITTADEDTDGVKPPAATKKKESSPKLLKEAKEKVDVYTDHNKLAKECKEMTKGFADRGLVQDDMTKLTDHINRKHSSLKPETV